VYPFTLEPHILKVGSNRRAMIAAHASRHEAYLCAREEEKQRRKREVLRRIAPGFEPSSTPLVPVRTGAAALDLQQGKQEQQHEMGRDPPQKDVMDDLVDKLAALEDSH